ncbi:helicase-related protein [Sorangium sp. So ce1389]|uniref:helicase-related protein n=1 Tax=Sorangium sp. So ce1389 TaxID=3133336 RepID=UPI003F5F2C27
MLPSPTQAKLDGSKVPQADTPHTLLRVIARLGDGEPLDAAELGVTNRQVQYYTQAARLFGFISTDKRMLRAGHALLQLPLVAQLSRLAIAFEQTECATRWTRWHGVRSLLEVSAGSAARFLEDCTTGIHGETLTRRAKTLEVWREHVRKHHPALHPHPSLPAPGRWRGAPGHTAIFETASSAKVVRALAERTEVLRAATAYLSVGGYEILTDPLREATMRLLVGTEQAWPSVADILRRFQQSIERGPPSESKQRAIRHFHQGVVTGAVRVRHFASKYKPRLHAKVYLFDGRAAYITSANLSQSGLRSNIEGGYVARAEEVVEYYLSRFEEYFNEAEDLVPEILPVLEESWAFQPLVSPYLLYLSVLLKLFPEPPDLSGQTDYRLARYQEMMVAAVLHILRERRRALLVAPTGTGKTVVGSYIAASLFKEPIARIVVLCPNSRLSQEWTKTMDRFGIHPAVITHGIMQGKGRRTERAADDLDQRLATIRDTDLVIVDECHVFRNPSTQGYDSLARLIGGKRTQGVPWLLLLTATPMSKGLDDLNTLLGLLDDAPLSAIPEIATARSVVNVTLPFIIEHFGEESRKHPGRGLMFGSELRFFPTVRVRTERYRSAMGEAFTHISRMRLSFRRTAQPNQLELPGFSSMDLDGATGFAGLIRLHLMRRAESSPRALLNSIERLKSRDGKLVPDDPKEMDAALSELRALVPEEDRDTKLEALVGLLVRNQRRKVLIFSMWTATVEYLQSALQRRLGARRVEHVTGDLNDRDRGDRIVRFAPEAQGQGKKPSSRGAAIDVLVATDAIAEGENLQDADIVVNYDLPWTPLYLIQRIGRVDRPTKLQREVHVWNFYPDDDLFDRMIDLWKRLISRSDLCAELSRTQVLGEHDRDLAEFGPDDLGLVKAFYQQEDYGKLSQDYHARLPTSAWLVDRAKASAEEVAAARALPAGVLAARAGRQPGTFALIQTGEHRLCVFAPEGSGNLQVSPDRVPHEVVLEHIRADRQTRSHRAPAELADRVGSVVQRWCDEANVDPEQVTMLCGEAVLP